MSNVLENTVLTVNTVEAAVPSPTELLLDKIARTMANQHELLEQQQLDAQSARAQNFTIYCKAAITPPFDGNGTKLGKFFDDLEMCGKAASASLDMLLEAMPAVMMSETHGLFLQIPEEERDTYYNAKSALQRKLEPTWA